MKIEEIVKALRCISTAGDKEQHCESCPFFMTEQLDTEWAKKVGANEWTSCDCDAVGLAAAGALEKLLDRCARYAEEIAVLQERQRWIPVTERLPDPMEWVLGYGKKIGMKVLRYDHITDDYDFAVLNGHGYCISSASVTHWMPLPEAPEVE